MHTYIGVTGFTYAALVERVARRFLLNNPRRIHLMAGILVSARTLRGITNTWPRRYPERDRLQDAFMDPAKSSRGLVHQFIHYNTDAKKEDLLVELLAVSRLCRPGYLAGFQLNLCWPDAETLGEFKHLTKGQYEIILQLGKRAVCVAETPEALHRGSDEIVEELRRYQGVVNHILLDLSGGYGRLFEPTWMQGLVCAIDQADLGFGIGIAGGLSKETLYSIDPLLEEFPKISIDAEGRLMDDADGLSETKVIDYVDFALRQYNSLAPSI
ncbi:MAG: hypothetical protein JWN89_144 [Parcubacteria group bacterium]|nr:hypothetical protein [Parcubacteria group bacterium]